MHNSLELFQTATAMARHAGSRQAVVARNIANADTPGFQAQHIAPLKKLTIPAGHTCFVQPDLVMSAQVQQQLRQ